MPGSLTDFRIASEPLGMVGEDPGCHGPERVPLGAPRGGRRLRLPHLHRRCVAPSHVPHPGSTADRAGVTFPSTVVCDWSRLRFQVLVCVCVCVRTDPHITPPSNRTAVDKVNDSWSQPPPPHSAVEPGGLSTDMPSGGLTAHHPNTVMVGYSRRQQACMGRCAKLRRKSGGLPPFLSGAGRGLQDPPGGGVPAPVPSGKNPRGGGGRPPLFLHHPSFRPSQASPGTRRRPLPGTPDPEVLVIQRGKEPAKGHWSLPGGSLALGEALHGRGLAYRGVGVRVGLRAFGLRTKRLSGMTFASL